MSGRIGDYVLALKNNQSKLFAAAGRRFAHSGERSTAERIEASTHDRREMRRATVVREAGFGTKDKFPGVKALGRITSRRRSPGKPAEPPLVRYFLLSKYVSAKRLLAWPYSTEYSWSLHSPA